MRAGLHCYDTGKKMYVDVIELLDDMVERLQNDQY